MRIARFTTGEDPQYGVVTGDVDELGIPAVDAMVVALAGDPLYVGVQLTEQQFPLNEVRLLAPVLPRSKVVGIGRNYAAHAAEMGNDVPDEPMMFIKPNTAVIGPGDPIFYPRQSREVHFEGELCVVIGRICRDVAPDRVAAIVRFSKKLRAHAAPRVLIHCHMGISRSTAAAIILLADHGHAPEAAVECVAAIRPIAWPNLRMIEIGDRLLNLETKLIQAVRRHHARVLMKRPELRAGSPLSVPNS